MNHIKQYQVCLQFGWSVQSNWCSVLGLLLHTRETRIHTTIMICGEIKENQLEKKNIMDPTINQLRWWCLKLGKKITCNTPLAWGCGSTPMWEKCYMQLLHVILSLKLWLYHFWRWCLQCYHSYLEFRCHSSLVNFLNYLWHQSLLFTA